MWLTLVLLAAGFCMQLWSELGCALPDSTNTWWRHKEKGAFLNQRLDNRTMFYGVTQLKRSKLRSP